MTSEERENEFIPRGQWGQSEPIMLTGERTEDTTRITAGLGLHYYFYASRSVSIYSGADFSYTRDTVDVELSLENRGGWKNKGEIFGASAVLGLQCRLLDNLGIYGEVGLGYSSSHYEHEDGIEATLESRRWGLANSGIGLIFYF